MTAKNSSIGREDRLLCALSSEAHRMVLIVDDEHLIRYSLKKLMEYEGYAAMTAKTGQEALRLLTAHTPDLVVLDIDLPDANGLDLLKTIKETYPSVSVVMATGNPGERGSREAMTRGALGYLGKPLDLDRLMDFIRSAPPRTATDAAGRSDAGCAGRVM